MIKFLLNRISFFLNPDPYKDCRPPGKPSWSHNKKVEMAIRKHQLRERERLDNVMEVTTSGRRAFFRGVAAAVGVNAFLDKMPNPYFEDGFLNSIIPEAEGDVYSVQGIGGDTRCQRGQDHRHKKADSVYMETYQYQFCAGTLWRCENRTGRRRVERTICYHTKTRKGKGWQYD